jgi:Family of unknown function (DUF6356)
MLDRWFLAHPRSIDESYLEHQACALKFSGSLLRASLACFVHALVPGLFERTGSTMVKQLHQEMATKRVRQPAQSGASGASSYAAFDVGI